MPRGDCCFTKDMEYCYICGRPAHGVHHLLFGSDRGNADYDGIYIPICDQCHMYGHIDDEMGLGFAKESRIHDNPMAEKLSKMLGQTMWELNQMASYEQRELLKERFRIRYGRSYL